MKKLLLILLVSICVIGYRSKDIIMVKLGYESAVRQAEAATIKDVLVADNQPKHKAMSINEYAELAKTDPNAYHKFMQSLREPEEHGAIDKLMNLLAHGKYE